MQAKSEIEQLYQEGKKWIASSCGKMDMFSEHDRRLEEKQITEHLLSNTELSAKEVYVQSPRYTTKISGKTCKAVGAGS